MPIQTQPDRSGAGAYISTGRLPPPDTVRAVVAEAHERFKSNSDGRNSDVYPALARVPANLFGICVVGTNGHVDAVGDSDYEFSIMSVSKPFIFALVCEALGPEQLREQIGVNATGRAFNSLEAIERGEGGRTNPMVNAGAIATTSLVGNSSTADCPVSRAARCRSTRRSTPPPRRPTSAIRALPACCRATAGSTWTRPRRPICTPGSAR
jgi:glutaminase